MIKKVITVLVIILSVFLLKTGTANADCTPIYGGGQSCTSYSFSVNKLVEMPNQGGNYVDNLSVNDPKFSPSQTVNYRIIVTNTSGNTINTINVRDNFPSFVNYVSGPGIFDANSKTLSFTINNLGANQSQTFNISATTSDANSLPNGVTCPVNQVNGDNLSGMTQSDSSQICILKNVPSSITKGGLIVQSAPNITKTPATGAETYVLAALLSSGFAGFIIRKMKTGGSK